MNEAAIRDELEKHRHFLESRAGQSLSIYEEDLSNLDLPNVLLEEAMIRACRFDGARLPHAKFGSAEADGASFVGCDLTNADFTRATLNECNFSGAMLDRADFHKAELRAAIFDRANLDGAKIENAQCARATWRGSSLRGARLVGVTFRDGDLSGADLSNAVIERCHVSEGTSMTGCVGLDLAVVTNLYIRDGATLSGEEARVWLRERAAAPASGA